MKTGLTQIEKAMKNHQDVKVSGLLHQIDKETANVMMARLSEEYEFPIVEVDGWLVTSVGWMSTLFMVERDSVNAIINKYELWHRPISSLPISNRGGVQAVLELHPNDSLSKLVNYPTLLVLALRGRSAAAGNVKQYLLDSERNYRVEIGTQAATGKTVSELKNGHDAQALGDKITIDKDRYIDLLETQNRFLKGEVAPRRKNATREEEETIISMVDAGCFPTEIGRRVGRTAAGVSTIIKRLRRDGRL